MKLGTKQYNNFHIFRKHIINKQTMQRPIYVTKPTLPRFEEYSDLIKQIWETGLLTNSGPLHEQLAKDLKKYLGVNNISLFANGHNALEAALRVLNLPKGSEVITTPYTFASTTHAVIRCGLKPVFCDISYEDYNMDVSNIESLVTENTSAILPVHVYGTPCDVSGLDKISKKYNLKVVYDAAHAFGVELLGKSLASFGDASMLSFHATKVFNTVEGGAVVSNDEQLTLAADAYKNFGMSGGDDCATAGTNAKMSEFHAAMGIANLKHVDESIAARKVLCCLYDELLKDVEGIKLLKRRAEVKSNFAYYPIVVEDGCNLQRDELCERLASQNIFARKYFFPITQEYSCFKGVYGFAEDSVAKDVSRRVLCLPLYDTLAKADVERICEIIRG